MNRVAKTLVAVAALTAVATPSFSAGGEGLPWEIISGMGYIYDSPGKMMKMAINPKSHDAMMKSAKKVPSGTFFFMDGGQMYMASGTKDSEYFKAQ